MEGIDAARHSLNELRETLPELRSTISPAYGLLRFLKSYPLFIKIQVNCWQNGQRLRFADKFFEVIEMLQASVRTDTLGKVKARAWPFHLTMPADRGEGSILYLLGLYSSEEGKL
jgi:hypothetical protein